MNTKYKNMGIITAICMLFLSCDKWLDVKPIDRISEEQLYSTESGYLQSLNGVYVELNHPSLYGGDLLFDAVEILAQRYSFPAATLQDGQVNLMKFDYTTDYAKGICKEVWLKAYALIANINKLLANADMRKEVFSGEHYDWITGEAYALRAFLHFDLLRLFGPVYATHKKDPAICYNTEFSLSASSILSAEKVVEYIIADLHEAEKRLATDPIIKEGPLMTSAATDAENYWRFRSMRLNYYAVKALQARVYLYAGMEKEACDAAKAVIAVQEKWFPFTKYTSIVGNTKTPDRVFSSELLFCMQNAQRSDIFENNFSPELNETQMLITPKEFLERIFGAMADKDWRYESIWLKPTNYEFRCFHKYEKTESSALFNDLIPLIRISEMYYIVAETSDDETEALQHLNTLLENRGLNKLESYEQLTETLLNEYQKEFWGEGQLWFYYKRKNVTSIPSAATPEGNIEINEADYKLPLPEIETDYR